MKKVAGSVVALRVAIGWLFLYAGWTKVVDPEWTAAGFLKGASSFSGLYAWFGSPANIGWVDFLNEWGLTLVGLGLIFGAFTRLASYFGILLMALYYFPGLEFPKVGDHSLLVDDHVINALVLYLLVQANAGEFWGADSWIKKQKWAKSFEKLL